MVASHLALGLTNTPEQAAGGMPVKIFSASTKLVYP